jgi:hypothetical protein
MSIATQKTATQKAQELIWEALGDLQEEIMILEDKPQDSKTLFEARRTYENLLRCYFEVRELATENGKTK